MVPAGARHDGEDTVSSGRSPLSHRTAHRYLTGPLTSVLPGRSPLSHRAAPRLTRPLTPVSPGRSPLAEPISPRAAPRTANEQPAQNVTERTGITRYSASTQPSLVLGR